MFIILKEEFGWERRQEVGWLAGQPRWLGDTAPHHTEPHMPVGWLCSPGAQLPGGLSSRGPRWSLVKCCGGGWSPTVGMSLLAPMVHPARPELGTAGLRVSGERVWSPNKTQIQATVPDW